MQVRELVFPFTIERGFESTADGRARYAEAITRFRAEAWTQAGNPSVSRMNFDVRINPHPRHAHLLLVVCIMRLL